MAPPTTVLEFLTRANPKTIGWRETGGGNTTHQKWDPIEGVQPLAGFTYNNCYQTYKADLKKSIPSLEINDLIVRARLNEIMNEDTIIPLVTLSNFFPVNLALAKVGGHLHFAPGSLFFRRQEDGSPDWGLGDELTNTGYETLYNYCPGDLKLFSKWTSKGLLDSKIDWAAYSEIPELANKVKPLEQIQKYCAALNRPWGWILTDKELVVVRVTLSGESTPSPRPKRNIGHQRGPSNTSTLSSNFSDMSIDASAYSSSSSGSSFAPLEIASIPWSAEGDKKMTINLGLYFLARLSHKSTSISHTYPSLDPNTKPPIPTKDTRAKSSSVTSKPTSAKQSIKTLFFRKEGIDRQVAFADIDIYLPDSTIEEDVHEGIEGYKVRYPGTETILLQEILNFLRSDTKMWQMEGIESYTDSATYKRRSELLHKEI